MMQAANHQSVNSIYLNFPLSFIGNNKNKDSENGIISNLMTKSGKSRVNILVVEDDPISQRVAQLALQAMGYAVDIAETGSKALELYQINSYDAILMDMGLPDISGVEVTQQIRELEQVRGIHTPIIALTAHSAAMAKNECLAAGMDDFSTKPLEIESLRMLLKAWIEKPN